MMPVLSQRSTLRYNRFTGVGTQADRRANPHLLRRKALMANHSTNIPARNAPCACGSGKKSKRCCGAAPAVQKDEQKSAQKSAQELSSGQPWFLVIALLGVIAVAVYSVLVNLSNVESGTTKPPPVGISSPRPWQYDAASNQHWEPSHKHWHEGRPPVSAGEANDRQPVFATPTAPRRAGSPTMPPAPTAGMAPRPWQYDAANNRHWDPVHQHWHDGPPQQVPRP